MVRRPNLSDWRAVQDCFETGLLDTPEAGPLAAIVACSWRDADDALENALRQPAVADLSDYARAALRCANQMDPGWPSTRAGRQRSRTRGLLLPTNCGRAMAQMGVEPRLGFYLEP